MNKFLSAMAIVLSVYGAQSGHYPLTVFGAMFLVIAWIGCFMRVWRV